MSPAADAAEQLRAALTAARKSQDKGRTLVLGTILANLKNREIELRPLPNLWSTWNEVVASTLEFSGMRLRYALPPP